VPQAIVSKCSKLRTQALSLNEFAGAGYKAKAHVHFLVVCVKPDCQRNDQFP